jgi:hypothetical protein
MDPRAGVTETVGFCKANRVGTGVARNELARLGIPLTTAATRRRLKRSETATRAAERRHLGCTGAIRGGRVAGLADGVAASIGSITERGVEVLATSAEAINARIGASVGTGGRD